MSPLSGLRHGRPLRHGTNARLSYKTRTTGADKGWRAGSPLSTPCALSLSPS
jgi:hypothetical protein